MSLLDAFRRQAAAAQRPPAAPSGDAVESARIVARRRLIGAAVLLAAGIVGFPMVFETQPRPVRADLPIEVAGRPRAAEPAAAASGPVTVAHSGAAVDASPMPGRGDDEPAETVERAGEAGREVAATPAPPSAARSVEPAARAASTKPRPASSPAERAADRADKVAKADKVDRAERAAAEKAEKAAAAERAEKAERDRVAAAERAARSAAAASAPRERDDASTVPARLVVQVGAYEDEAKLREARSRVERLGLRTYTQVVQTDGGRRTRVRVGPFASRADADAAAAKLRAAGLPTAVLAL